MEGFFFSTLPNDEPDNVARCFFPVSCSRTRPFDEMDSRSRDAPSLAIIRCDNAKSRAPVLATVAFWKRRNRAGEGHEDDVGVSKGPRRTDHAGEHVPTRMLRETPRPGSTLRGFREDIHAIKSFFQHHVWNPKYSSATLFMVRVGIAEAHDI